MFRVLNKRKGPAVWGPRAQIDRALFKQRMFEAVRSVAGLELIEAEVTDLHTANITVSVNSSKIKSL